MNEFKTINILFCGTGGQGVLKAAEICARAAMLEGFHVKKSEVHGMSQRGGSVESHLRFGRRVFSPLIPYGKADYLISFHEEEHRRLKKMLKPGGSDLTGYLEKACRAAKDKRYLNIFLLGVLSSYLSLKEKSWLKAIDNVFPAKISYENRRVFAQGRKEKL